MSTAPLTSTATFFPLSNQTASSQMQLQGIHLVRMTDPVLSAQFGGIKSNSKSRFSNNKHSKNVIHTSASPCWGWTLMGTRFLPSFHPQSRGGSRVSTAFPICELYIHTHTFTHTHPLMRPYAGHRADRLLRPNTAPVNALEPGTELSLRIGH